MTEESKTEKNTNSLISARLLVLLERIQIALESEQDSNIIKKEG